MTLQRFYPDHHHNSASIHYEKGAPTPRVGHWHPTAVAAQIFPETGDADSLQKGDKMSQVRKTEKKIAISTTSDLIAADYKIAVFDGEEISLEASDNAEAILAAMFATDEEYLYAMAHVDGELQRVGWVRFIYGNNGFDVINDCTTNLEGALTDTLALAERLELQHRKE
ncbi:hypothetical protein [Acidithiobacillus caldus]|nr:hypothetical protein [Acidithiobacillus caldus]